MNNDQHPLLGALGLCRKAGKLLHGYAYPRKPTSNL